MRPVPKRECVYKSAYEDFLERKASARAKVVAALDSELHVWGHIPKDERLRRFDESWDECWGLVVMEHFGEIHALS